MLVDGPCHERRGLLHGSSPVELGVCGVDDDVEVGVTRSGSIVGDGAGVSVGNAVGRAVSVGGTCVLVGIAAWVSATIVNAAATDVD